ncbi:GDSL-type esterase/lipase family protein [Nitrospinae bacterium AH_259_B05_G02_I21]|nr:GDSL-type esterase/lipase family protein [Nitrospinae bacterium AH_259_B05_G02_I21]MDA2932342.1 GDSL-type esterase/lipase family protein [Nitrospinae bacterium AH-259-F20]
MRRGLLIVFVNCLVLVGLAGVLFFGLEIYLRTTDHLQIDISLYSPFNNRLNPLFRGNYHGGYVTVNRLGLRGPETTRKKPPGTLRIAFFGDSYTFGDEIDLEDTFPYMTQEILNHRDGQRVEVLNFGIPGHYTLREYSYLKEEGLAFEPDIVVVVYSHNDAFYLSDRGPWRLREPSLLQSFQDYLAVRSYAFYYIRRGVRTLKAKLYFRSLRKAAEEEHPKSNKVQINKPGLPVNSRDDRVASSNPQDATPVAAPNP